MLHRGVKNINLTPPTLRVRYTIAMSDAKIIIGLGNPGAKYALTRHNAGHMLIEYLRAHPLPTRNYQLLQTDCFMNTSGTFVKNILSQNQKLKTENLYVAHDDLDIPLGKYKISYAKGPKIHNGILSIEDALGTSDFWRIRIGVDNRDNHISDMTDGNTPQPSTTNNRPPAHGSGEQYVLSQMTPPEHSILLDVFGIIHQALSSL